MLRPAIGAADPASGGESVKGTPQPTKLSTAAVE